MTTHSWSIQRHPYLALTATFAAGFWFGKRWSRQRPLPASVQAVAAPEPVRPEPESPSLGPETVEPYASLRSPEGGFSPAEGLRGGDVDAPTFGSEGGGGVPTVT